MCMQERVSVAITEAAWQHLQPITIDPTIGTVTAPYFITSPCCQSISILCAFRAANHCCNKEEEYFVLRKH